MFNSHPVADMFKKHRENVFVYFRNRIATLDIIDSSFYDVLRYSCILTKEGNNRDICLCSTYDVCFNCYSDNICRCTDDIICAFCL